jgi:hypothetical protein
MVASLAVTKVVLLVVLWVEMMVGWKVLQMADLWGWK